MDRIFESGAAGSPPSAPASPSSGYPTAGNPQTATPATKPGPWWYHQITEELRAVIVAAGLTPDHTDINQLLDALTLLGLQDASETLKGRIEIATDAEVAALTDSVRAITPAGLGSEFTKSFGYNGYQKLPGGLIVQWGYANKITTATPLAITYPITFPTGFLRTIASIGGNASPNGTPVSCGSPSNSGFSAYTTTGQAGQDISYVAFGY